MNNHKDYEPTEQTPDPWSEGNQWSSRDILRARRELINAMDTAHDNGVTIDECLALEAVYGSQIGDGEISIAQWRNRLAIGTQKKINDCNLTRSKKQPN